MDSEWIEWDGSHRKGPRDGKAKGFVRFRDGGEYVYNQHYDWSHYGVPGDIVAYRLIEDK